MKFKFLKKIIIITFTPKIMIKKIIIDEFKGKTKFSKEIKFLRKSSRSPVYVSKRTGLIHHKSNLSTEDSLNLWSKKYFQIKLVIKN